MPTTEGPEGFKQGMGLIVAFAAVLFFIGFCGVTAYEGFTGSQVLLIPGRSWNQVYLQWSESPILCALVVATWCLLAIATIALLAILARKILREPQ